MRQNLSGTEPFGSLPTNAGLDLFLGREVKSLETEVLSDPAFMLLLSRFAAGRFHSRKGGGKSSGALRKLRMGAGTLA